MSESPNEIFFCSGSLNVGRIFIFARGLFVPNWPNGSHNQKIIFCSVPRRNTIDVASNQRLHINTWIFGMTTQSYVGFRGFCGQFHFVGHCLFHLYNITNSQIGLSSWPASGEKMLWPQFLLVINRTNHACTGWAITSRTSRWEFGRKGRAAGARWTKRPNQLTERSTQVRKVRVHPVVGKQARGQSKTNLVNNNGPRHSPINHGPPYISHTSELPQDTLLLLGDSDGPAPSAGGLGVLTSHADAPIMTETAMRADLLQTLEILSELVVQEIGHHLTSLAWKCEIHS